MKINFGKPYALSPAQYRDGVAQGLINGYIDQDDSYKSRYGLKRFANALPGIAIDGLYTDTQQRTIAVCAGRVFGILNTGVYEDFTGDLLEIGTLCTFAEDTDYVYAANGGRIIQISITNKTCTALNSVTAPDGVTSVIAIQGYLLANGTSGIPGDTFYTGPTSVAGYTTDWEVYNNQSLADDCRALAQDGQFVFAFGSQSIEISHNDGVTPWAKYGLAYIPYGIHAYQTLAKIDNTAFWLGSADNSIRVMKLVGTNAVSISTPYDAVINSLSVTDDAYSYSCGFDGHTFYVLQFPSEELTLVYHIQKDAWYQWSRFNVSQSTNTNFLGRCHTYNPVINKNLIGLTSGGDICGFEGTVDRDDVIRFELTSGNISGGTYKQKRASRMRFQLARGTGNSYTEESCLKWLHRDDGGKWSPERNVSLGFQGQYNFIAQLDRCGIYRERQHRIVFTDFGCQLILVAVEENNSLAED